MPEFISDDQSPSFSLKVHFRNMDDVAEFAKLVGGQKIAPKTKSIWYPQLAIRHAKDFKYE